LITIRKNSLAKYVLEIYSYCPFCGLAVPNIHINKKRKYQSLSEVRRDYPRAYEPWTREEDSSLIEEHRLGIKRSEIAKKHQRKTSAINSRLQKLGLKGNTQTPARSSIDLYVVFEDYAKERAPKVHLSTCRHYQKWKEIGSSTTNWYGPFDSFNEAWEKCKTISTQNGMQPQQAKCCMSDYS